MKQNNESWVNSLKDLKDLLISILGLFRATLRLVYVLIRFAIRLIAAIIVYIGMIILGFALVNELLSNEKD